MDAARWVTAAESALPWGAGTFIAAYRSSREEANELALEVSPVAAAMRRLLNETGGLWESTCHDLLVELNKRASETTKLLKSWPKTAKGVSSQLRRVAPNFRSVGIDIEFGTQGRGKERHRFVRVQSAAQPSPPSPSSPAIATLAEPGSGSSATFRPTVESPSGENSSLSPDDGDDGDGGDDRAQEWSEV